MNKTSILTMKKDTLGLLIAHHKNHLSSSFLFLYNKYMYVSHPVPLQHKHYLVHPQPNLT